jgi:hypothetical protein
VKSRLELIKSLSAAREAFYSQGFRLPLKYLSLVEAVRARTPLERDFQGYLDEVLGENLALDVPWQIEKRGLLDESSRSAYLDFLGELGEGEPRFADLDINFNIFLRTKRFEVAPLLRAKKEVEALSETWRHAFVLDLAALSAKKPLDLLTGIALENGYCQISKAKDFVEFKKFDRPELGSVRLIELEALKKRGDVVVGYRFEQNENKGLGLGNIVPGGFLYSQWNANSLQIAHAFCAQLHLFSILASLQ